MVMPNGRERLAQDRASRARREEARDLLHIVSEQHGGARGDALAVRVAIDGVVLTERAMKLEGECEALRRLVLQLRSEAGLARERIRQAEERAEAAPGQARAAVEEEVEALRLALAKVGEEVREARAQASVEAAAAEARVDAVRAEGQARDLLEELQATQARLEQAWAELAKAKAGQDKERARAEKHRVNAKSLQARSDAFARSTEVANARADAAEARAAAAEERAQPVEAPRAVGADQVAVILRSAGRRGSAVERAVSAEWMAGPDPLAEAVRRLAGVVVSYPHGSTPRARAQLALVAALEGAAVMGGLS
jgi:hypothetical protein